jgi:phage N-6-adenine-methyltransferase
MIEMINNKSLTKSSQQHQKDVFETWLLRSSQKTRITYSFCLKKFLNFLKSHDIVIRDINQINSKSIMLYSDYLKSENLSNKYINLQIATLSSCFDFYYREQVIEKNPCDVIRRPPQDTKKLKQVLTPAEIERLEQAFRDNEQHLKTLFIVLTETGQRISSILNLKKKDIFDLEGRKVIKLKLKRDKQRLLPLTRKAENALLLLAKDKNEDEYIFKARNSNKVISICAFNKTLKRKALKAKVKKRVSSHIFRRTLIHHLIKTHSLDAIKDGITFHSDVNTLYSYKIDEEKALLENPIIKNEYNKSQERDEYKTPRYLIERLENEFGQFTLDAAANEQNKVCEHFISKEKNALVNDWATSGIVFCNPPYSQKQQFLDKAIEQAKAGQKIILLVPASPETEFFRQAKEKADWLLCLNGRLVFDGIGNTNAGQAKFATMLVYFNINRIDKMKDLGWSI